jgi:hypothetical protein
MAIKDNMKIIILALPFAWLASIILPFFHALGWSIWIVETLNIQGYWPINIVFYAENLLIALITAMPYVGIIFLLMSNKKHLHIITAVLSYSLFTFLLCFQQEHLTACFFTLVQSIHIALYLAIFLLFKTIGRAFFCKGTNR